MSITQIFMAKIIKRKDAPRLETVKGRHGEILMAGEKCMMMINTIEPGLPTPLHSHPHEQIGYLQEGEGDVYRGNVKIKVGPITAQYKGVAKIEKLLGGRGR